MADSDNVQVAVRMRPFNKRETEMCVRAQHGNNGSDPRPHADRRGAKLCIRMLQKTAQTIITDPGSGKEHTFTFDYSYNSFVDKEDSDFCSQTTVWKDIGVKVLGNALEGYNVSLFAYGQTGAGKSCASSPPARSARTP